MKIGPKMYPLECSQIVDARTDARTHARTTTDAGNPRILKVHPELSSGELKINIFLYANTIYASCTVIPKFKLMNIQKVSTFSLSIRAERVVRRSNTVKS